MRNLNRFWLLIIEGLSLLLVVYSLICSTIFLPSTMGYMSGHLIIILSLVFIIYPITESGKDRDRPPWIDILFVILSIIFGVYAVIGYMRVEYVSAIGNPFDIIMTIIALLLVTESARRTIGLPLTILVLSFMIYPFVSGLPGVFAHRGFSFSRITTIFYFGPDGIYGTALQVCAYFIYFFLLYGALLEETGVSKYFIDLALSLTGRFKGGVAYAAVLSSGFVGMISGSAAANVAVTGTFTIPLMKEAGFKNYNAGAIEAYASTGGYITPPVMGASAFVLAQWLGIAYWKVVLAAIAPAFLYYLSAWYSIYTFCNLNPDIKIVEKSKIPSFKNTFKKIIFILLSPLLLIIMLYFRYPLAYSIIATLGLTFILSYFKKETRIGLKGIINLSKNAAYMSLKVTPVCAAAGIVVASVGMTGLGNRISDVALRLGGYDLFLGLSLVGVMSIIFGMGLPAVAAYIIVAILGAPTLIKLGVAPLVAHFTVLWYAALSNITPPVAIAGYVAAGIAKSPAYKTCWQACKLALPAYFLPFVFVSFQGLIIGSLYEKIIGILISLALIFTLLASVQGFFIVKLKNWQRSILFLFFIFILLIMHYNA